MLILPAVICDRHWNDFSWLGCLLEEVETNACGCGSLNWQCECPSVLPHSCSVVWQHYGVVINGLHCNCKL